MRPPRLLAASVAALLALSVAACTTGPTTTRSTGAAAAAEGDTGADAGAFPVTLRHAYGTTTLDHAPTRVATLGWSDQDFSLALGVAPVGAVKITWGGDAKGSTPWYDAKQAELGTAAPERYSDADGAPVEEIARLAPDLILPTNSGITRQEYARLSKIAPVVAFPDEPWGTAWQTSLDLVAKALGRSSRAASNSSASSAHT